jgi:hypothetical protein
MNGRDIEQASSADHLALGTVVAYADGRIYVQVDHLEEAPSLGQRVTITAGWDGKDLGESPEQDTQNQTKGEPDE